MNRVGDSPESLTTGLAVSAQVPDAPVDLLRSNELTTTTEIGFTWDDGAFDGASPIIDY